MNFPAEVLSTEMEKVDSLSYSSKKLINICDYPTPVTYPLSYAMGFLLILAMKYEWMIEEAAHVSEGHSVSKTLVILFLFYGYSCITLGSEVMQLLYMALEVRHPEVSDTVKLRLETALPRLRNWNWSKYVHTISAVGLYKIFSCMFTSYLGIKFWSWFWWNHVCKSYHDRTCKGSWIGKLIREYRNGLCHDGETSNIVCEKLVSYSPIMILTIMFVFMANILLPFINDRLTIHYYTKNIASLKDALERLETYSEETTENELLVADMVTQEASENEFLGDAVFKEVATSEDSDEEENIMADYYTPQLHKNKDD